MYHTIGSERQRAIREEIIRRRLAKSDPEIQMLLPANI